MRRRTPKPTFVQCTAVVFALLLIASVPATAVAGGGLGAADHDEELEDRDAGQPEPVSIDRSVDAVSIDDALEGATGRTEMVVRFGGDDVASAVDEDAAVDALQQHAEGSQLEALRWAAATDGVEVENTFWIFNGMLLEVDADAVSAEEVARQTGAERVHANFEVTTMADGGGGVDSTPESPDSADSSAASAADATYGLEMINATEVWDVHGTQGEGAAVAVLDTGIDAAHPDLDLYTEDPDDPTYPGGYMAFDSDGTQLPDEEPEDTSGHGTHVSGTVAGAAEPAGDVPTYGVAPEIDLLHGQVIPGGSGSFAQVAAGMEWAVDDTHADVVTMSLGGAGYSDELVEPSENARDAGVVLVGSAGNDGDGISGSPGNVYPNFASGAVDESHDVADFSGGEAITTDSAYPDAPDYWPDEYTVPNAAAPGVDVLSAVPGGGYDDSYSGTSMSAPHKAGTFALMIAAADGEADRETLYDAMEETAWKPDSWDEPDDEYDTRYGQGIVDALEATNRVALESGIEGTVTDADGEPIDGAVVEREGSSYAAETDETGEYAHLARPGEHTVAVDEFGYEPDSETVDVPDETFVERDFELADALEIERVQGQPDGIESGDSFDVAFDVANVETLAVETTGGYDGALAVVVDDREYDAGETIDLDDYGGSLSVTVQTSVEGSGTLELAHAFTGAGDATTVETGPTDVVERDDLVDVAVVDEPDGEYTDDVVALLEDATDPIYTFDVVRTTEVMDAVGDDEYDAYVVQHFGDDDSLVEDFTDATASPDTGVVLLDQHSVVSNGITKRSDVLGDPAAAGIDEGEADDSVYYTLESDHALFDGVGEAGDTVELFHPEPQWVWGGFYTYFDDYDGLNDGETVATVGNSPTANDDGGLAVDRFSSTVLAASLGVDSFVAADDFEPEAVQILDNAIRYASEPPPLVPDAGQPTHVAPGDSVSTTASVENLEKVTVSLADESTVDEDDLDLYVDGRINAWDEWRAYDPPKTVDEFTVSVETDADTVGTVALETTYVFDSDDEITHTTGPTAVYDGPLTVGANGDVETVQEAVDLAPDGTEIVVQDGTYEERVAITDTENLTVTGEDGATIVSDDDAVYVGADGTTLEGLTADGVTVEDVATVAITDVDTGGVALEGVSDASITDVTATGSTTGLAISDSTAVDVTGLETSDVDTGVHVSDSTAVDVTGASVDAGDDGIVADGSSGVTVTDTDVAADGAGVTALDTDVTIEDADVTGADEAVHATGTDAAALVTESVLSGGVGLSATDGASLDATLTSVDAETGASLADVAPDDVTVEFNDLSDAALVATADVDETADLRLNYVGDRDGGETIVDGDAVYDPFLTELPDAVDHETADVGTDLHLEAGATYAIGLPGPTDGGLMDLFEGVDGVAYTFDADEQEWVQRTGNVELESMEAMAVTVDEDARIALNFQQEMTAPSQAELVEGWNFVPAPVYGAADDAFAVGTAEPALAFGAFEQPAGQLGPRGELTETQPIDDGAHVSAFEGYFVFAEADGLLPGYLPSNPAMAQLYGQLGLDADVDGDGVAVDHDGLREPDVGEILAGDGAAAASIETRPVSRPAPGLVAGN